METIKEVAISSIGEPAHFKLEKNSKGYNYEISLHGESFFDRDGLPGVISEVMEARRAIEQQLVISAGVKA